MSQVTYGTMLSICDEAGDWVLANEIMKDIKYRKAVDFNVQMYSSAIGAFTKGGEVGKALELFDDAKRQKSLILDAPLYSKVLNALAVHCKDLSDAKSMSSAAVSSDHDTNTDSNTDSNTDTNTDTATVLLSGNGVSTDSLPLTFFGQRALHLLAEMTSRNLRITPFPLVQVIETLNAAGNVLYLCDYIHS